MAGNHERDTAIIGGIGRLDFVASTKGFERNIQRLEARTSSLMGEFHAWDAVYASKMSDAGVGADRKPSLTRREAIADELARSAPPNRRVIVGAMLSGAWWAVSRACGGLRAGAKLPVYGLLGLEQGFVRWLVILRKHNLFLMR